MINQLKDIKIIIGEIRLTEVETERFFHLKYMDKKYFLLKVLSNPRLALKLPIIFYKILAKKRQSIEISDLYGKLSKQQFRDFFNKCFDNKELSLLLEDISKDIKIYFKYPSNTCRSLYLLIKDYLEVILSNQYNVTEETIRNKIIIDAGSHFGLFSLYCARLGAKRVYAFEPMKETFEILKEQIKLNNFENIIIPINKALGDINTIASINFNNKIDISASLFTEGKFKEEIREIKLDTFCKEEDIRRIDFIKMDVESFEENVLIGASKIIKRDKPILALSAYHKITDIKRLPEVIKGIRNDYNIKLLNRAELDFYCY
jgi:FkbM family methyltransferase